MDDGALTRVFDCPVTYDQRFSDGRIGLSRIGANFSEEQFNSFIGEAETEAARAVAGSTVVIWMC
jgi:hypothetical protein